MKIDLQALAVERPKAGVERRRAAGERLELVVYDYAPGATFPIHSHEAEQLTIVLEGELIFVFEEEEIRLGPGEALVIPGERPHCAYVPAEADPTRTYNIFTPVRERPPG